MAWCSGLFWSLIRGELREVGNADTRWYLLYHTPYQIIAGYLIGFGAGASYFFITEYIPLVSSDSIFGRLRAHIEWLWEGIGGIGGHEIGGDGNGGGWGEGWIFMGTDKHQKPKKKR